MITLMIVVEVILSVIVSIALAIAVVFDNERNQSPDPNKLTKQKFVKIVVVALIIASIFLLLLFIEITRLTGPR